MQQRPCLLSTLNGREAFDPFADIGQVDQDKAVAGLGFHNGVLWLALTCTLAACASVPRSPAAPSAGEELNTLENEPGPFCGRCDVVKITALSDGRVWVEHSYWAGDYRDRRVDLRLEHVSPESYARFRGLLQPYRPTGERALQDEPPCHTLWSDVDGVRVGWHDGIRNDRLLLNFGCDPEDNRSMAEALRAAPDALGITGLRLPWGQWVATTH